MKRLIYALSVLLVFINFHLTANATDNNTLYKNDGIYVYTETTILEEPSIVFSSRTLQSKTVNRTNYYTDKDKNVLWTLSLTATFNYDGYTAVCANCSHQANAVASGWSIKSASSGHNGNAAAAVGTALHKELFNTSEHQMSVTLTCDPDGTIH